MFYFLFFCEFFFFFFFKCVFVFCFFVSVVLSVCLLNVFFCFCVVLFYCFKEMAGDF